MIFGSDQTYYDLLEVSSDASAQEIKNSYLRIKAAYRKDNLALYSLHEASESADILERIEEAYETLHDSEKRRDYDARHAFTAPIERDEIPSIDRVPPMETSDESDLLIPPATDFEAPEKNVAVSAPEQAGTFATSNLSELSPGAQQSASGTSAATQETPTSNRANLSPNSQAADASETDWTGSAIRKIRETKRYSLDDISTQTRISKTYLQAIEDEAFDKLPAPVFVRGFIIQYAKFLKIPHDAAAQNYMARFKKAV